MGTGALCEPDFVPDDGVCSSPCGVPLYIEREGVEEFVEAQTHACHLEMNLIVVEDSQLQPSDLSAYFSIGGLVLFAEPPRREQRLQEPMQILTRTEM